MAVAPSRAVPTRSYSPNRPVPPSSTRPASNRAAPAVHATHTTPTHPAPYPPPTPRVGTGHAAKSAREPPPAPRAGLVMALPASPSPFLWGAASPTTSATESVQLVALPASDESLVSHLRLCPVFLVHASVATPCCGLPAHVDCSSDKLAGGALAC